MKQFIGTKVVSALPMTRGAYNVYRGWVLPENENGDDEGYLVECMDGGKPNDSRHVGYISWSPKEQFDRAYNEIDSQAKDMMDLRALMINNAIRIPGVSHYSDVVIAAEKLMDFVLGKKEST